MIGKLVCGNLPTIPKISIILLIQFGIICLIIQLNTKFIYKTSRSFRRRMFETEFETLIHQGKNRLSVKALIEQRINKVNHYCSERKDDILASNPNFNTQHEMLTRWVWMASKQHQLFYCAAPKCGSTTWKTYILEDSNISINTDTHEWVLYARCWNLT